MVENDSIIDEVHGLSVVVDNDNRMSLFVESTALYIVLIMCVNNDEHIIRTDKFFCFRRIDKQSVICLLIDDIDKI